MGKAKEVTDGLSGVSQAIGYSSTAVGLLRHAFRFARDPHPALPLSLRSRGRDDESSLINIRARYYEPGSRRFWSEDPARQGANRFAYCGNSPSNAINSSGLDAAEALCGIGTGSISIAMIVSCYEFDHGFIAVGAVLCAIGIAMYALGSLLSDGAFELKVLSTVSGFAFVTDMLFGAKKMASLISAASGLTTGSKTPDSKAAAIGGGIVP